MSVRSGSRRARLVRLAADATTAYKLAWSAFNDNDHVVNTFVPLRSGRFAIVRFDVRLVLRQTNDGAFAWVTQATDPLETALGAGEREPDGRRWYDTGAEQHGTLDEVRAAVTAWIEALADGQDGG